MQVELLQTNVRDFQHNMAKYLQLAQTKPLGITKHGQNLAVVVNPKEYEVVKKTKGKQRNKQLMTSEFVGMYKNRKDWQGKTSLQIADKLRTDAWYGK